MLSFFLFFKVMSSAFQVFFVSFWNVHFRRKSMFSYLGRSCTPTISKKIKSESEKSEKKNESFRKCGEGCHPGFAKNSKDTGNRVFRSRWSCCPKRSDTLSLFKKWEHFVEAVKSAKKTNNLMNEYMSSNLKSDIEKSIFLKKNTFLWKKIKML